MFQLIHQFFQTLLAPLLPIQEFLLEKMVYAMLPWSLLLAAGAGLLVGCANLAMRKSIDWHQSSIRYFILQYAVSGGISLLFGPLSSASGNPPTWSIGFLGGTAGCALALLALSMGASVRCGPAGLSLAIINTATLAPALIGVLTLGSTFGYVLQTYQLVGIAIVIVGFFIASKALTIKGALRWQWGTITLIAWIANAALMVSMHWRQAALSPRAPVQPWVPITLQFEESLWFFPILFFSGSALLWLWAQFTWKPIQWTEYLLGICGGLCMTGATYFWAQGLAEAQAYELALIFPTQCSITIVVCQIWGRILYREQVQWRGIALLLVGLGLSLMGNKVI